MCTVLESIVYRVTVYFGEQDISNSHVYVTPGFAWRGGGLTMLLNRAGFRHVEKNALNLAPGHRMSPPPLNILWLWSSRTQTQGGNFSLLPVLLWRLTVVTNWETSRIIKKIITLSWYMTIEYVFSVRIQALCFSSVVCSDPRLSLAQTVFQPNHSIHYVTQKPTPPGTNSWQIWQTPQSDQIFRTETQQFYSPGI